MSARHVLDFDIRQIKDEIIEVSLRWARALPASETVADLAEEMRGLVRSLERMLAAKEIGTEGAAAAAVQDKDNPDLTLVVHGQINSTDDGYCSSVVYEDGTESITIDRKETTR